MDYEERFKRLIRDLTGLLEHYVKDWAAAEQETAAAGKTEPRDEYDSDAPETPVIYPPKRKKSADISGGSALR